MIDASRELLRLVHPRRGHAMARARRTDPLREFEAARAAWAKLRSYWVAGWAQRKDELAAIERAADAILTADAPPREMQLVPLAAAERMLNGGATLVGCIAARLDVGEALRVKAQSAEWKITSGRKGKAWWWMLAGSTPPATLVDAGWRAVRVAAATATDGQYADAREIARALRDAAATPEARVRFDFAFPTEPEWAKDDLRALLAGPSFTQSVHVTLPLLASVDDEALLTDAVGRLAGYQAVLATHYACDVVAALPVDAATRVLGVLAARALASRQHDDGALRPLAIAMSAIRTEAMAHELARWLRHPRFGRWVASYFERNHELARVAVGPLARGKSIAADCARALLAANARAAEPDAGSIEDAPRLLASPPWKAREPLAPIALATLPWNDAIAWQPGERERLLATPPSGAPSATVRAITTEELAELDALPEGQRYVDVWPRWENKRWLILELPEERTLALWDAGVARLYARPPCWMLARFGERALPGLYARSAFEGFDDRFLVTYLRVASPPGARVAARLFARRRSFRVRARAWLVEHPEVSAIAAIPAAFERETRGKRVARRALGLLAHEHPAIVKDVARRYGREAEERVHALCFCEPLARIDVRGRAPKWLRVASLPPLRTRDGRLLPRAAAETLVDILRCRGEDVPYAGIAALKDALDATSLDAFAWALFHAWLLHGAPRTHGWMARALAAFPRDDTALRLQPHVREAAHGEPRACSALVDVLAAIGDDGARLVLEDLEHDARSSVVREVLAEALGADRGDAALDLDLDARGEATIDLGARTVRVVLDESLVPRVVLEDGRRLAQMPRASKNDDPRRVAAATARFKRLSRVARGVAKTEVVRLERAMLASRRWRAGDLQDRWARHPLVARVARRIVWGVFAGPALVETFRVAEDGSFADDEDQSLSLEPDGLVGVVHPLDLEEASRARWSTIFGDYEIVQPFEQLGRLAFGGTPKEAADLLASVAGAVVAGRSLLETLDAHGWTYEGRRISAAWRQLRGSKKGLRATVTFNPAVDVGAPKSGPKATTTLGKIAASSSPSLAEIDRVDLSELVRTALALRA